MTTKKSDDTEGSIFPAKDEPKVETVEDVPAEPEEKPQYEEEEQIRVLEEVLGELQSRDPQTQQLSAAQGFLGSAINSLKVVANKSLIYGP